MENIPYARHIVKNIFGTVEGLIGEREGQFLYSVAKGCKGEKGVIVEIGSWKGRSTICLGKGSIAGSKVKIYAIDPHRDTSTQEYYKVKTSYEEFKNNIRDAGVDDVIFPIMKTSEEAARIFNEPIEFLFIDGEHDYENVKLDFESWYPKVIYGGFIAFHDYNFSGPYKVIEKYVFISKYFKIMGIIGSILFVQKVEINSLKDRLLNAFLFLMFKCAFSYNRLHFPKPATKLTVRALRILKIIK
ncbi:MAG: class I SAM-dependent methyltransferase [Candidatus Omnitrophota bacterium]|nr:class I SAM-dependent methyltransferase [Candidatus Omnitrophota bacterium]